MISFDDMLAMVVPISDLFYFLVFGGTLEGICNTI